VILPLRGRLYPEIYSDENLTEAWHRVRTRGSNTAGADGITLAQYQRHLFRELRTLQDELRRGRYRPLPAKQVLLPKGNGDVRPIGILSVRDRVAQWAVLLVVTPVLEADFEPCSYGYRPGRSREMALQHMCDLVDEGLEWAVHADIEKCFESIDIKRLRRLVAQRLKDRKLRRLIYDWLTLDCVEAKTSNGRHRPCQGLLQGSPLSPLMANLYLDQFDKAAVRKGLITIRYADDFVILCRTERQAEKQFRIAKRLLKKLGLSVNPVKTFIGHVGEGLTFLGATLVLDTGGEGRWVAVDTSSLPSPSDAGECQGVIHQPLGDREYGQLVRD